MDSTRFSETEVERSAVAKLLENLAVLANGAIDVLLPVHRSEPAVAREESVHAQPASLCRLRRYAELQWLLPWSHDGSKRTNSLCCFS